MFDKSFKVVLVQDLQSKFITEHVCLNQDEFENTATAHDETIVSIKTYPKEGNEEFIEGRSVRSDRKKGS